MEEIDQPLHDLYIYTGFNILDELGKAAVNMTDYFDEIYLECDEELPADLLNDARASLERKSKKRSASIKRLTSYGWVRLKRIGKENKKNSFVYKHTMSGIETFSLKNALKWCRENPIPGKCQNVVN